MIEIRTPFNGWQEVTEEVAKTRIEELLFNLPAIPGKENKIKYINENRLRGTTVERLLCKK